MGFCDQKRFNEMLPHVNFSAVFMQTICGRLEYQWYHTTIVSSAMTHCCLHVTIRGDSKRDRQRKGRDRYVENKSSKDRTWSAVPDALLGAIQ